MKYKFTGTQEDLIKMGFKKFDDGWYSIDEWDALGEEDYTELFFIVENDGTCYFNTTNEEARIAPDADNTDDGEAYTYDSYMDLCSARNFPLNIACRLFMSGLIETVEESGEK